MTAVIRIALASVLVATGWHLPQSAVAAHHSVTCNSSGYVLQPDTRYRARETIYLGKSCDAYSDAYSSNGKWCWAERSIRVRYDIGQSASLPFSLPACPQIASEVASCKC